MSDSESSLGSKIFVAIVAASLSLGGGIALQHLSIPKCAPNETRACDCPPGSHAGQVCLPSGAWRECARCVSYSNEHGPGGTAKAIGLGGLVAPAGEYASTERAQAIGTGGAAGTATGVGGAVQGTIGVRGVGTVGNPGGKGSAYGRGTNAHNGHPAAKPTVNSGQVNVRGSLDKEIIRRVGQRHIDDMRHCYEIGLRSTPHLSGRISVQFTIAATGEVIASVLQSSTMGSLRVENCAVQAVRRWDFPKPMGGGIVIVSYPFNFTAGTTGD